MSFHATILKRQCLISLFLVSASFPAFSQAADSPVIFASTNPITTTFVDAPSFGGAPGASTGNTKWLKVEFHYSVAPDKGDFLDAVQFKIWIEGLDLMAVNPNPPGDQGVAVGLTGSVTYVNIARSKDVYGVFFVHPATLARYSSSQGYNDFDRKFNIHIDAMVGGKVVDNVDKNKETDLTWFQQLKAVPGFVCRQDQCPFMVVDVNRCPPIKLSTSGE